MPDFLLEVGLEEIPARMIEAAQAELARRVQELLGSERVLDAGASVSSYSTPRRLAVLVRSVLAAQADAEEQLTGPSWNVAFKNGEPTPAALAFAKKAGVEVGALQKATTAKGEYASATVLRKGRSAAEVLTEHLPKELGALYWPKNMYWRAGKPERFVRPVKWLLAILDHAIVPVEFAGVHAGNLSYGHRILHGEHAVTINKPAEYVAALESAKVLVDVESRRQRIRKALDAATRTVAGARWREDEALVDMVTHLTEWPSVLLGNFEGEYLSLPEEVLVTVMRDHQKYFAVEDASGKLAPHFLTVLNTEANEQGIAVIRHGNERVLRSRFSDARFFWDFDQKIPLIDRVEMLKSVTFHKDLGSYFVKTEANLRIAEQLALLVRQRGVDVEEFSLLRATKLAKTDLTAELVKEFTELQGVVGGLYARAQGLGEVVAQAIYSQYMPASTDDPIPATVEGQILGLVDRFQTIAAMFAIGLEPTGSKDPFALRRAANGVVKILAETSFDLRLSLYFLVKLAIESQTTQHEQTDSEAIRKNLLEFFRERLDFYLRDVRGFSYDVVNAVIAADYHDIPDAIARAEALSAVRGSEDFAAISAAFKRMKNIVRQASEKGLISGYTVTHDELLTDPAESNLHEQSRQLVRLVDKLRLEHKYREALEQIATLRPHVDLFFDKVMVMVEDSAVRQNRLALINEVLVGFSSIADFSEIVAG
jgi:glycyl-tRNA synthetase beta chain